MHIQLDQEALVGSRALGQTFVNAFPQAVTTWAKYILEQFTCQVLCPLALANWAPDVTPPVKKVSDVHDRGLAQLGYLMQAGVLQTGPNKGKYMCELLGILEDTEATMMPAPGQQGSGTGDQ